MENDTALLERIASALERIKENTEQKIPEKEKNEDLEEDKVIVQANKELDWFDNTSSEEIAQELYLYVKKIQETDSMMTIHYISGYLVL